LFRNYKVEFACSSQLSLMSYKSEKIEMIKDCIREQRKILAKQQEEQQQVEEGKQVEESMILLFDLL
jgi:hypothetical protein